MSDTSTAHSAPPPRTLPGLAHARGLYEDPERGSWHSDDIGRVLACAADLGVKVVLPDWAVGRAGYLRAPRGRLIFGFERRESDPKLDRLRAKKGSWEQNLRVKSDQRPSKDRLAISDPHVREVVSGDGGDLGTYTLREGPAGWVRTRANLVPAYLLSRGIEAGEIDWVRGAAVEYPWRQVCQPFQPEWDDEQRTWNRRAPQFAFEPSADDQPFPHWSMIFSHCFRDLDDVLKATEWGAENNVLSGHDFGVLWLACLLRDPACHLPYLFLYGDQNGGKSILHEAIALLLTRGVASADRALTSDFCGELENAVLAFVEEKSLAGNGDAYARLKNLVTSPKLWIRRMNTDAYPVDNFLHFIQSSNEKAACPVSFGDSRVIALHVDLPKQDIPKPILTGHLKQEAPGFLRHVLGVTIPKATGRLALPCIETVSKQKLVDDSIPDVIRGLAELTEWRGTCAELSDKIGVRLGNIRSVRQSVGDHQKYLSSKGVKVTFDDAGGKRGTLVNVTLEPAA